MHLCGRNDGVVTVAPVRDRVGDVAAFLGKTFDVETAFAPLRRGETTGRSAHPGWIERLEHTFTRPLAPRKRGPKPKEVMTTATGEGDLFSKLSP